VLGRHHPELRRLRALRRDPGLRRAEAVFIAEGPHLAREALGAGAAIEFAVASPRLDRSAEGRSLRAAVAASRVPCLETSDATLDALQDVRSPQPIVLLVRRPAWPPGAGLAPGPPLPLVVVLHALQDPGNLGTILRTAHAAGATAAFVCGEGADPYHPRAVRASMGAIFHLPLAAAGVPELLAQLAEHGIAALAADAAGEAEYGACDLARPLALFFGGEGAGLPGDVLARMEQRVRVPLRPGVDSLSVGAAAAVLLFEAARQRRGAPRRNPT